MLSGASAPGYVMRSRRTLNFFAYFRYFPRKHTNPLTRLSLITYTYGMALTDEQKQLLAFFEQNWYLHATIPTAEKALTHGFSEATFKSALKSKDFLEALTRRGIQLDDGVNGNGNGQPSLAQSGSGTYDGALKPRGLLTPEQLTAVNVILDFRDTRSQKKKLQELQISSAKWNGWLRQPVFQDYITRVSEHILADNLHESHLALMDRVRSGDIGAIKYFNEMTGRYTQAKNDKVDVASVLMRVLEIIQVHVHDPIILTNISRDFLVLAEANEVHRGMVPVTTDNPRSLPVGVSESPNGNLLTKPSVIDHGEF